MTDSKGTVMMDKKKMEALRRKAMEDMKKSAQRLIVRSGPGEIETRAAWLARDGEHQLYGDEDDFDAEQ